MLEIAFRPDRDARSPVYRQLTAYLRELIETGRIPAGEKLPASRDLALALGVSRNTINQSYQGLIDAGFASAHVGQGTFATGPALHSAAPSVPESAARRFAWGGMFAKRTRGVALPEALGAAMAGPVRFDFRPGRVDVNALPRTEFRRAASRALADLSQMANQPSTYGWSPLREAIAQSLVARGIACAPEDVIVTSGAQQALDLVARVLVDPGDNVAMEQPGYFGASLVFAANQAQVIGVGVDEQGLRTHELAQVLRARRVKLIYTTPAVQSPTGVVMSEARRRSLLALADRHHVPVIEDDYDSELRYGGPVVPALKTQDTAGQIIYIGTFSKALFPGLRVGYAVAAPPVIGRIALSRAAADFGTDVVSQAILTELLTSGAVERHVRRVRKLFAERRAAMLEALERELPEGSSFAEPAGGNAIWIRLAEEIDPDAFHAAARENGLAYVSGDAFYVDGRGRDRLLLSFASLLPEQIRAGVAEFGAIARWHARRGRTRNARSLARAGGF